MEESKMTRQVTFFIVLLIMVACGICRALSCQARPHHRSNLVTHPKVLFLHIYQNNLSKDSVKVTELDEFQKLYDKGLFCKGRYSFNWFTCFVNARPFSCGLPYFSGSIKLSDKFSPIHILTSYDPFNQVLYISDDEYDDYGNGLVISNLPPTMIHYSQLNMLYPKWMDYDIKHVKRRLTEVQLDIEIVDYHQNGKFGAPFRYLLPYLHTNFGTNVILRSDCIVFNGNHQVVIRDSPKSGMGRRPEEFDVIIGNKVLSADEELFLGDAFFIDLTNALIQVADKKLEDLEDVP